MKDDEHADDVGRVSGERNAPIGHSWELIDRRVIELWLGSQSGVSLPHFGPTDELRGIPGAVKPGT